jgi:glycosyltransferase involved in cell wall biosynthesis
MVDAELTAGRRRDRRIAYLSFGSGQYDARTFRMARSAIAAGYDVTVYARWYPGLPWTEERDGYRIVRAPFDWRLAIPGLRGRARRRVADARRVSERPADQGAGSVPATRRVHGRSRSVSRIASAIKRRVGGVLKRPFDRWWRLVRFFPLYPLGWAEGLGQVAEPADIWHGMWAGSLPALSRLKRRSGGRTIYDSRDVYMQSRDFATAGWPGKPILERLERYWARRADRILTVNAAYAGLLAEQLHLPPPRVVMNCPERWTPPDPRPDVIRDTLGLPASTAVVLYQGGLMTGRGIEQSMDAILDVPNAVLCLMGFGRLEPQLAKACLSARYQGRVFMLDPTPPDQLLTWTASADVSVMAIQPTSINHRFTTPQKLFESLAVGVPVVASDLPGMAEIVRADDLGRLCDPTSPASIAAAIRDLLDVTPDARDVRRGRILGVAHERYAWESQVPTLLEVYRELD